METRKATLGLAPVLPGLVLVLIIFWALAAVLMLTGTLINAREIEDDVEVINGEVQPIDKDLDSVKLAGVTADISGRILERAEPLTGQADEIIVAAGRIDRTARQILSTAGTINETAGTINASVRSINGSVRSINGNVISINEAVDSIGGKVGSIGRSVDSIGGSVTSINGLVGSVRRRVGAVDASGDNSINASVGSIFSRVRRLAPEVRSIDSGVAAINRRASDAIQRVAPIKTDFAGILSAVGFGVAPGPDHGPEIGGTVGIHGHANSIDCSNLLQTGGRTQFCDR